MHTSTQSGSYVRAVGVFDCEWHPNARRQDTNSTRVDEKEGAETLSRYELKARHIVEEERGEEYAVFLGIGVTTKRAARK